MGISRVPVEGIKKAIEKAHYTVSKRENKKGNTYLARVREKSKGVVVFSKSKSSHTKSAALKWAKQTLHKVEHNTELATFDLVDGTLTELIQSYIEKKQASDKPLCRTAIYSYKQISSCKLGKITVSRITSLRLKPVTHKDGFYRRALRHEL